jgi:hypothetical protein
MTRSASCYIYRPFADAMSLKAAAECVAIAGHPEPERNHLAWTTAPIWQKSISYCQGALAAAQNHGCTMWSRG